MKKKKRQIQKRYEKRVKNKTVGEFYLCFLWQKNGEEREREREEK